MPGCEVETALESSCSHYADIRRIRKIYDAFYSHEKTGPDAGQTYRDLVEIGRILANFSDKGLVLDAGCGTGRGSIALATRGTRTVGIDISVAGTRRANAIANGAGLGDFIDLLVADVEFLPFRECVFDGVIFMGTFEYFADIKPSLVEACRVMRLGALCLMNVWHASIGDALTVIRPKHGPRRSHSLRYICDVVAGSGMRGRLSGHFFILPGQVRLLGRILRTLTRSHELCLEGHAYRINERVTSSLFGRYVSPDVECLLVRVRDSTQDSLSCCPNLSGA